MGEEKTRMKDSFVMHIEDFEDLGELKDAEAGKLLRAIIAFATEEEIPKLGVQAKTMFGYIRRHMERDKAKYEATCRKRAEAGCQGGRPKKETSEKAKKANGFSGKAKKANGFSEKQMVFSEAENGFSPESSENGDFEGVQKAKKANGFFEKQNNPDNDNDPEPDIDPDNDPEPDIDPDNDPEPDIDPEREPEPVPPEGGGGEDGASGLGEEETRRKRISFLTTMCNLYRAGCLEDKDDYDRYRAELETLKGR